MLSWWLGKGEEAKDAADDSRIDVPETPAPVFAARALKSAFFGTPALVDTVFDAEQAHPIAKATKPTIIKGGRFEEDEILAAMTKPSKRISRKFEQDDTLEAIDIPTNTRFPKFETEESLEKMNMSPSKRGILVAPGTISTGKKNVSFNHDALEKRAGLVGNKALRAMRGIAYRDDTPHSSKTINLGLDLEDQSGTPYKTEKLSAAHHSGSPSSLEDEPASKEESPMKARSARKEAKTSSLTKKFEKAREQNSSSSESARNSSDEEPKPRNRRRSQTAKTMNGKESKLERIGERRHSASTKSNRSGPEGVQEPARNPPYSSNYPDFTGELDNSKSGMTLDLNHPKSHSGKFWQSEFKTYHDEAQAEMAHLLRYKHLAKSFARKKDSEAMDLAEKLREEQQKVMDMEDLVAEFTSKSTTPGFGDDDDTLEQVQEVAKLRAMISQYKKGVEEFRVELEEPRGKRKRSAGVGSIVEDSKTFRAELKAMEKSNKKFQDENARLTRQLQDSDQRLAKQRDRAHARQQSQDEQLAKKDEAIQSLQKEYDELKKMFRSSRRELEELLSTRQDQIATLKKEVLALRNSDSTIRDLKEEMRTKTAEHEQLVANLQRQLSQAKRNSRVSDREEEVIERESLPAVSTTPIQEPSRLRESHIPVSVPRSTKRLISSHSELSAASLHSSQRPLSEIINSAGVDTAPPPSFSPVRYTPMTRQFEDLSLDTPTYDLPSQPLFARDTRQKIHERSYLPSPGPADFNIPSSPPKPMIPRPRSTIGLSKQKSNPDLAQRRPITSMASSQMEGSRARVNLPPARAAAAKARLEQKAADKKKAQAQSLGRQKENVQA